MVPATKAADYVLFAGSASAPLHAATKCASHPRAAGSVCRRVNLKTPALRLPNSNVRRGSRYFFSAPPSFAPSLEAVGSGSGSFDKELR
jgi:hypothetical protein